MEDAIRFAVAGVAASVARAGFEENGLDVGSEKREIERNGGRRRISWRARFLGIHTHWEGRRRKDGRRERGRNIPWNVMEATHYCFE